MSSNYLLVLVVSTLIFSCGDKKEKKESAENPQFTPVIKVPEFNSDSAYSFVKKQVDFGPRIPNSTAHNKTGDYLVNLLKESGAVVTEQQFDALNYEGESLRLKNIIASYSPEKQKRILLAAHWDTRPFADKDKTRPNATFDGANDGASGVGVLLEIARVLHSNALPEVGVDIILFDGEDWGERIGETQTHPLPEGLQEWWCLGSQHWARHKHRPAYAAYYGILLDMVGAKGAKFYREEGSLTYAPSIVEKVWNTASTLGYAHIFVKQNVGAITDDHIFVNETGRIPMIDIVQYDPALGFFGDYHHSQKDNIDLIDKLTLQAVGETVLAVVYAEK
jgi:hypothetical protein